MPLGSVRLIEIGSAPASSSIRARLMGSEMSAGIGTRGGAPKESWRALAPTIRARSNRVSLGGPIVTSAEVTLFVGWALFLPTLFFLTVLEDSITYERAPEDRLAV